MKTRIIVALGVLVSCGSPRASTLPPPAPPAPAPPLVVRKEEAPKEEACDASPFDLRADVKAAALARIEKKRGTMGRAKKTMVVTSHRAATEAALAVLRSGGTAADAFVAAVLVQDVVFPGVTSTAGLTGIVVYDAKTKKVTTIHGGVGDPIDPARRWKKGDTARGKQVVIPGAPAAYAELVRLHGKKKLAELVEPAAKQAEGYSLDKLFARSIAGNAKRLEHSAYFNKTYLKDGKPLAEGEKLARPDLAATLRAYGKDPTYFSKGAWAKKAVEVANAEGGSLDLKDFATYPGFEVHDAVRAPFGEHEVYSSGFGGVSLLVSLTRLAEARDGARAESPSTNQDALERIVKVHRATSGLAALHDREIADDAEALVVRIAKLAHEEPQPLLPDPGHHSSAAIVVDAEGNVVVGTHTIQTLNWGEGLFVGGVPLSTCAATGLDDPATAKKRMRIDPLTDSIVFTKGAPSAALAVYGTGLSPADIQILDSVLSRGVDAEDAVLEPRVGFFSFDFTTMKTDPTTYTVDPRFDGRLLCMAGRHGVKLTPSMPGMPAGYVDTGFPSLVVWRDGELHGMPPDPGHIDGLAKGD